MREFKQREQDRKAAVRHTREGGRVLRRAWRQALAELHPQFLLAIRQAAPARGAQWSVSVAAFKGGEADPDRWQWARRAQAFRVSLM